jgi:alpha,alpha-trehalase
LALPGKPAPALFLEAARRLGVSPERAIVLEDAVSGVEAGVRGGFGLVVGVDRGGRSEALRRHGAHVAVSDLEAWMGGPSRRLPSALRSMDEIRRQLDERTPAVFLDYDGTLTPIVDRPDLATLSTSMRETVRLLAKHCTVAIVSGRDRSDVERLVDIDSLVYAGSHGFDIAGPGGLRLEHPEGARHTDDLERAAAELRRQLDSVAGVLVEPKRYALAVHYRLVSPQDVSRVRSAVDQVATTFSTLRKTGGKKIFELRPAIAWDKGKAVLWLLDALDLDRGEVLPLYLGDDVTDEDAFAALDGRGLSIRVGEPSTVSSRAQYGLTDTSEVERFLGELTALLIPPDRPAV